ncbi:hypothetical protein ACFWUZ_34510 [Streptomyces sp. NPDC058646]|uniref:hypothetical protein n=1 Tax=Streptomyces sp. NPDC058646 TaxID=3346574 RepID=UPI00365A0F2E
MTQGLPRAARFALLLAVGAACAALWLLAVNGRSAPLIAGASFAGTLAAGFTALRRQVRRLLAQQYESLPWLPSGRRQAPGGNPSHVPLPGCG